jgi:hypothetical protein
MVPLPRDFVAGEKKSRPDLFSSPVSKAKRGEAANRVALARRADGGGERRPT